MKVKICGIKTVEEIGYCNELLPDFIGFVFAKSKRQVSIMQAEYLKSQLDKRIKAVGVFVNEDIDIILTITKRNIIDLIQLHGNETNEYIEKLKKQTNLPIIKANDSFTNADYVLFDNIEPGSGKEWDFKGIKSDKYFFIAGGLNINNVKEAIKLNPYAVDVSSGVEENGFKSYKLMKEFIGACRYE